ncbi:hypothetical protein [Pyrococcus sp. ST04]|uniref:hypothetical protein n=1 Tax=Pyrococcus sp. ST04 TaxID=1183377 RepID=UPI00064E3BB3|nr:hypothetical protein [Pyrococcus sp. ST04]
MEGSFGYRTGVDGNWNGVGGAVEEGKAGCIYGLYRWHKTGDWKEFVKGVAGGYGALKGAELGVKVALKVGAKTLARFIPYVGVAIWA